MKWKRVPVYLRIISSILAGCSFAFAWYLKIIGAAGIEDVPPPFILFSGLAGLAFLLIAIVGKAPWFNYNQKHN
jgi:hypothetical protein